MFYFLVLRPDGRFAHGAVKLTSNKVYFTALEIWNPAFPIKRDSMSYLKFNKLSTSLLKALNTNILIHKWD